VGMMKKKTDKHELFFLSFIGEYVTIILKREAKVLHQTEEGYIEETVPMTVNGYLLDMDDEYYFIGESPNNISRAILKKEVVYIEIVQVKTVYDEILDTMNVPQEDKDIN
jgi:hypothetical protein